MENLLKNKDFEALSPEEKSLVLATMSESKYTEKRKIFLTIEMMKAKSSSLSPNPEVLARLKSQFPQSPKVIPIWKREIPVWAAAASVLGMFILTYFFNNQKNVESFVEQKQVLIHDTLVQKIPLEKIVYQDKIKEIFIYKNVINNDLQEENVFFKTKVDPFEFVENDVPFEQNMLGQSLDQDSLSMSILSRINMEK